jgi:uncharacterized membrane protein
MKVFLRYFLRGLVFVIPVSFTIYIIYSCITWIDNLLPGLFNVELFPGSGLLLVVLLITAVGYLGSSLIAKPLFSMIENYIYKIPLINLIYSSTKDIVGALVGDKKKFNHPVLVKWSGENQTYRIGFITQNDLKYIEQTGKVAVYFPDSYNISGNLFIVDREHVLIINAPSSEVMKFVVSGGVSGFHN